MIGSDPTLVAAVVPVVAFFALAFWLGLVFYAGSHPFWRHHQQAAKQQQQLASSGQTGTLPPPAKPGLSGSARGAPGRQHVAHR
jgi:hypothetical protein